jgi:hypothetical protein
MREHVISGWVQVPKRKKCEETYQMLHNSARDCGWSLMMAVAIS